MVLLVLQDFNNQTPVKFLIAILFLLLVPKLEFHMPLLCLFLSFVFHAILKKTIELSPK